MGLKKHFCSLKILCAIFRGHFGNFGNLGGTNNTIGKLWGSKSNFGKGICGLRTHGLGVFLFKVFGLGLRLFKLGWSMHRAGVVPKKIGPTHLFHFFNLFLSPLNRHGKMGQNFWLDSIWIWFFFFLSKTKMG